MDDIVLRGMAKWPNVPAVYGWLAFDRRGNWLLKGEKISNAAVLAFIARNYAKDGDGRWFFQNGPQRVYVDLEYVPFVYRAIDVGDKGISIEASSRRVNDVRGAWIDEAGMLLIETELGVGVLDDRDLDMMLKAVVDRRGDTIDEDRLEQLVEALQRGDEASLFLRINGSRVALAPMRSADVPGRFGFVQCPSRRVEAAADEKSS